MGREIRKVPKGWEHTKKDNGQYQPMHEENYETAINDWFKDHQLWLAKEHPDQLVDDPPTYKYFAEWGGNPPDIEYHVTYKPEDAICFQVYENVSEGTPVSPVFDTMDLLKEWLISQGHSEKAAEGFCNSGYAPSAVMTGGQFKTGIDTHDIF